MSNIHFLANVDGNVSFVYYDENPPRLMIEFKKPIVRWWPRLRVVYYVTRWLFRVLRSR